MDGEAANDAMSAVAPLLRVRPELQDICHFAAQWSSLHDSDPSGCAQFHIVVKGRCLLERQGVGVMQLNAGDILLLPHGDAHILRADISAQSRHERPMRVEYKNALRIKTNTEGDTDTELICGRLRFETAPDSPVIAALPDIILLRSNGEALVERAHTLLQIIYDELEAARAGSIAIAEDLASALFMMMMRSHFEEAHVGFGLLALIQSRSTTRAVLAMLRDPAHNWTLDELAAITLCSRSTLVRTFRRLAGVTPLGFLTELRLNLARRQFGSTSKSLPEIAATIGYHSESALARAFQRRFGITPGEARRKAVHRDPN